MSAGIAWLSFVVAMGAATSVPARAGPLPLDGPAGFSFKGGWICEGNFPHSGKPHRATIEATSMDAGAWIDVRQVDTEPEGYVADFIIGNDALTGGLIALIPNNQGYSIYHSTGWQGGSLTFEDSGTNSYATIPAGTLPPGRFIFEAHSADGFRMTWMRKDGADWPVDDLIECHRK